MQPGKADPANIKAPINAQYGGLDTRITIGWPAFDASPAKANVAHEGHMYHERHMYKAPITAFTTTQGPATTKPPPMRRGDTRWIGSTSTCEPEA